MYLKRLGRCVVFTLVLILNQLCAQNINDAKWWAGVRSGVNFTSPVISQRYAVLVPQNTEVQNLSQKEYNRLFKNKGPLFGIMIDYSISPSFALSIQPSYQNYQYTYNSIFSWRDSSTSEINFKNTYKQRMDYIEIPLLLKFGKSFGKLRLHIQGGAYYGRLLGSKKIMYSEEKYLWNGEEAGSQKFEETFDLKEMNIPSNIGILIGGGISFDINYFRLGIECNYKNGLNNITNVNNRYSNSRLLSAAYDVPDNISLNNLELSLHCYTPLDFLIHLPEFSGKPKKRK